MLGGTTSRIFGIDQYPSIVFYSFSYATVEEAPIYRLSQPFCGRTCTLKAQYTIKAKPMFQDLIHSLMPDVSPRTGAPEVKSYPNNFT